MKTITLIIAVFFSFQISTLFANSENPPLVFMNDVNANYCIALDPSTPTEATFEDVNVTTGFELLGPVTPKEAGFDEEAEITILTPTTPAEADFE